MSSDKSTRGNSNWMERKAQAEKLCDGLVGATMPSVDIDAIRVFAADPKWEVRKVIAEALSNLPESIFRELGPVLSSDSNVFVSSAAGRSSARRIPRASLTASAPGKIQQAVDRIATKYGNEAAEDAMRLAHMMTERHLRSAVHDIKNILTGLSVEPDKFTNVTAIQKRKLIRLKQGTDYLRHLVDMMAQYSADPNLEFHPESIAEIVVDACASAVEQIENEGRHTKDVECTFSIPKDLMVRISRFHILMMLTNLIKNGIESHAISPNEMKRGGVRISAELVRSELVVTVSDQGRGISPSDLAQLREFIPGGSSKRKTGAHAGSGTGYGLPISRRYVDFHGGSLDIESTEGRGTVVVVRIPHKLENE